MKALHERLIKDDDEGREKEEETAERKVKRNRGRVAMVEEAVDVKSTREGRRGRKRGLLRIHASSVWGQSTGMNSLLSACLVLDPMQCWVCG